MITSIYFPSLTCIKCNCTCPSNVATAFTQAYWRRTMRRTSTVCFQTWPRAFRCFWASFHSWKKRSEPSWWDRPIRSTSNLHYSLLSDLFNTSNLHHWLLSCLFTTLFKIPGHGHLTSLRGCLSPVENGAISPQCSRGHKTFVLQLGIKSLCYNST